MSSTSLWSSWTLASHPIASAFALASIAILLVLFIAAMKVGGYTLLTLLSRRYIAKWETLGSGAIERSKCVGLLTEFLWQKVGWVCYTPPSFFFFYPDSPAGRVCEKRQEILFPFWCIQGPICGKSCGKLSIPGARLRVLL